MAYDITKLKADLEGVGHGTTLNKITNVNGLINRAARQILLDVDPQETKRIVNISSPLYDEVYDYPLPSDLKGNKVIDIIPQGMDRFTSDQTGQAYNEYFDVYKNKGSVQMFTMKFNSGIKTIRLAKNLLPGVIVNQISTIDDNGTWSAGLDATDLTQDNIYFIAGGSSLRFNLDGSSNDGFIENSDMQAVNLTEQLNQGAMFLWVYLPSATAFNNVSIAWGSSNADYWESTVTQAQDGTAFQVGWNLLAFDWPVSATGAPDVTAINYVKINVNYDGVAIDNIRVNLLVSRLGTIYQIEYYSKFLFRNPTTGAFQETVLTNSDLINLDTESYNLLTDCCAVLMAQQMQGEDSSFDYQFFETRYKEALARYRALYKSEVIKPKQAYYQRTSNSFRRWFGTGPNGGGFGI